MVIEYKITFSAGAVTVTQRIEPGASSTVQIPPPPQVSRPPNLEVAGGIGRQLGASIAEGTRVLGDGGGGSGDKLDTGGGSGDKLDTGGGAPGAGIVINFGPIIVMGAGRAASDERGGGSGDKTATEGVS
ncbi:MAG: hypothetical protein JNN08_02550 [Bryobacterales bacterium]|nr:hypothetical protein [Bryobacterales bacterium]